MTTREELETISGLRVLITNVMLSGRSGTELYAQELAAALVERGHTPFLYSTQLGPLAEQIRRQSIPVVDDLGRVSAAPDIIHGQHNFETMTALLRFPCVPAVYFYHDNLAWQDVPPRFPRILRYVAVDDTCRDRLVFEHGIPEERVRVLRNSVDLRLFAPRPSLPARPRRALAFGNSAGPHLEAVRRACAGAGLALDVHGSEVGAVCDHPAEVLGGYDIVFAKGRCALEAMAVGAAVILCGRLGLGPLVTSGDFEHLRALNFGHRALRYPFSPEVVAREIARYDPADAAEVSRRVRAVAGRDQMVEQVLALYEELLAEFAAAGRGDAGEEGRAAAAFLRWATLCWRREREKTRELMLRSTTVRLRNRLLRVPLLGALGLKAAGLYRRSTSWGGAGD